MTRVLGVAVANGDASTALSVTLLFGGGGHAVTDFTRLRLRGVTVSLGLCAESHVLSYFCFWRFVAEGAMVTWQANAKTPS